MKKYLWTLVISILLGLFTMRNISFYFNPGGVITLTSSIAFMALSLNIGIVYFILMVIRLDLSDIKRMLEDKEKKG